MAEDPEEPGEVKLPEGGNEDRGSGGGYNDGGGGNGGSQEGNGGSSNPGSGEGDSGSGGTTSQSEDVVSSIGRLLKNKEPFSKPGGYGRGGKDFKIASDQPGGEIPSGILFGCTDNKSSNYNPLATMDDGSCLKEQITGADPKVISKFSSILQGPPESVKFPDLGLFNKFLGLGKGIKSRTGVVLNNSEEEGGATSGNNTFKAGTANVTHSSFSRKGDGVDGGETELYDQVFAALPNYIKSSYMIATQKECGECDEQFVDQFLEATAILQAIALAGNCIDYTDDIVKINTLTTSLINRKCKNC